MTNLFVSHPRFFDTLSFTTFSQEKLRVKVYRPNLATQPTDTELHNLEIKISYINSSKKNIKKSPFFFVFFKLYLIFVPSKNDIVQWCNGSTTDSGPVCPGSNPG